MNQRLENHTTHKDATCTVTLVSGSVDSNNTSKHLLFAYCIAEDYQSVIEGWADSRHTQNENCKVLLTDFSYLSWSYEHVCICL